MKQISDVVFQFKIALCIMMVPHSVQYCEKQFYK